MIVVWQLQYCVLCEYFVYRYIVDAQHITVPIVVYCMFYLFSVQFESL